MKFLKPIFITSSIAVALIGCKTVSKIPVPKAANNTVVISAKKTPLTNIEKETWGHADLATDTIPGMSIAKAYQFLEGKKGFDVVVGVLDSGTDLKHVDLSAAAWINEDEIPNNGKDDDNNGYIDDINGWNFLGPIFKEAAEVHRILKNPKLVDAATYQTIKKEEDNKKSEASINKTRFNQMLQAVIFADNTLAEHFKKKDYTKKEVAKLSAERIAIMQSANIAKQMYGFGLNSLSTAIKEIKKEIKTAEDLISGDHLKKDYREALGDNAQDFSSKFYGDNKTGPVNEEEAHGTHVSGIIAATRDNGLGTNGITNKVKIMAVRVVPDGDEYDKDVALGIRYAVDNGAKVINTSFGKSYSPNKQWVYEAILYAAEKDVLIVNAAGNDGKNIDEKRTYPNDSKDLKSEISDNVITIGAISANYDENLPADFSNYGKINVDIFAPGVQIYATIPQDKYEYFNGTSMAAPSTAGVAALIRSYYPALSASQVKHIIMNSGTKIDFDVIKPGSISQEDQRGIKVPFSELSVSGRIVNAYNALKMANRMVYGK
ncbi:MAG: S8 family peptidase [Polaribacter sp.]|nr:S8 family peptidase [Polaribacter sp.]MDG1810756.1 S8 family peptidase [Polaribacter sp.]